MNYFEVYFNERRIMRKEYEKVEQLKSDYELFKNDTVTFMLRQKVLNAVHEIKEMMNLYNIRVEIKFCIDNQVNNYNLKTMLL